MTSVSNREYSNEKNKKIAETRKKTQERRANLSVRTVELKINKSKLSKAQIKSIHVMTLESKWLYNDMVAQLRGGINIGEIDTTKKYATVRLGKDSQTYEQRLLICLPASMKQFIKTQIGDSLKGLSSLKKNGYKVGALAYKKENPTSLIFRQVGSDFKINIKNNTVRLAKIGTVKVRGLSQLSHDAEIAGRLKLLLKPSGYYLHVTCYVLPEKDTNIPDKNIVGLDFGIKTMISTSDGVEYDCKITHSTRLKNLQKALSRKIKGSNNYLKTLNKIKKEYELMNNKKDDYSKKVVRDLLNSYQTIIIQDENIKGWHSGWFGKQVQSSCLGRIKSQLMKYKDSGRVVVVPRWCSTTKLCLGENCHRLNKISLGERVYSCECGYKAPRDIHSAQSMIYWAKSLELI